MTSCTADSTTIAGTAAIGAGMNGAQRGHSTTSPLRQPYPTSHIDHVPGHADGELTDQQRPIRAGDLGDRAGRDARPAEPPRHHHPASRTTLKPALEAARDALLVLGNHRRGALTSTLLGSVAQRCVPHANCPLVLVPAPTPPGHPEPR